MMKVYLDTCILSRILDARVTEETLKALDTLCNIEDIEFVTSKKTLEEFLNTSDDKKRIALKLLYKIITKIPSHNLVTFEPAPYNTSAYNKAPYGKALIENPLFTVLKQIFDDDDAEHVFQAVKADCQFFLTLDFNTILNRVKTHGIQISQICSKLIFVDPIELINRVSSIFN